MYKLAKETGRYGEPREVIAPDVYKPRRARIVYGYDSVKHEAAPKLSDAGCNARRYMASERVRDAVGYNAALRAYIDFCRKNADGQLDGVMVSVMSALGRIELADGTNYGLRVLSMAFVLASSNLDKYATIEHAIRSILFSIKRVRGFKSKSSNSGNVSLLSAIETVERYQTEKRSKARLVYGGLDNIGYKPDYMALRAVAVQCRQYARAFIGKLSPTVRARLYATRYDIKEAEYDVDNFITNMSPDTAQFFKRLYIMSGLKDMSYKALAYIIVKYM